MVPNLSRAECKGSLYFLHSLRHLWRQRSQASPKQSSRRPLNQLCHNSRINSKKFLILCRSKDRGRFVTLTSVESILTLSWVMFRSRRGFKCLKVRLRMLVRDEKGLGGLYWGLWMSLKRRMCFKRVAWRSTKSWLTRSNFSIWRKMGLNWKDSK